MNRRLLAALLASLTLGTAWACAPRSGAGSGSSVSLGAMRYSGEELSRTSYDNLYLFLRSHTNVRLGQTDGPGAVRVRHQSRYVEARLYVGGSEQGSPISQLRQIAPSQVQSLKILPPDEASSRYGGYGRIAIIDLILK